MSCAYQYGRRDDPAAGGEREGERAGRDLLPAAVRRDEHVGRRQQVRQLVDRKEPVVELDDLAEAELQHPLLEHHAVALALAVRDVGVRAPCNHVDDVGAALEDRRKRLDHRLEPLPRRDQPERREQEAVAAVTMGMTPRKPGVVGRTRGDPGRSAVRDDADLLRRAGAALDEEPHRGVGHDDHELGLRAQLGEHRCLMRRRLREHGVERDDERLGKLLRERKDVLAVGAAEDPVLVLQAARRRRRGRPGSAQRGRSPRGLPARSSPEPPGAAGSTARGRRRRDRPARYLRCRRACRAGRRRTCRCRRPAADTSRRSRCAFRLRARRPRGRAAAAGSRAGTTEPRPVLA